MVLDIKIRGDVVHVCQNIRILETNDNEHATEHIPMQRKSLFQFQDIEDKTALLLSRTHAIQLLGLP
eukprot:13082567-Ditylum_brightwellii.AAC.1